MKDKLEPNMYVRTKNGNIRKIVELTNTKFIDEPDYYVDKVLIDIEQNEREDTIYMEKWLFNEDIVKSSHNIIDLIEVGDYVNGHRVDKVVIGPKCSYVLLEEVGYYVDTQKDIDDYEIKSVVTSQQFESLEYKIV